MLNNERKQYAVRPVQGGKFTVAYKSIDQQLHEMEEELKLAKEDYKKMERHRDKLLTRDRNKEQKERTRRLIQKGAIYIGVRV